MLQPHSCHTYFGVRIEDSRAVTHIVRNSLLLHK